MIRHQYSPTHPSPDSAPDGRPAVDSNAASQHLKVPASSAGERVDQALAALMPEHSRSRLQQWIREGRVRVDGRLPRSSDKVWGGEQLEVSPGADPRHATAQPEAIALQQMMRGIHF